MTLLFSMTQKEKKKNRHRSWKSIIILLSLCLRMKTSRRSATRRSIGIFRKSASMNCCHVRRPRSWLSVCRKPATRMPLTGWYRPTSDLWSRWRWTSRNIGCRILWTWFRRAMWGWSRRPGNLILFAGSSFPTMPPIGFVLIS